MSKKVYRTEAIEVVEAEHPLKLDELVWFHERRDGRRYEHLARVDALLPDREVTLSYTVTAEPGRQVAARVPELLRESTGSGWVKAV